jgi:trk system potassium uptake protein TrkA
MGRTGRVLIEELYKKGYEIAGMDLEEDKCKEISSQFDIMVFKGNVTNIEDLKTIRISNYDLLLAVTGHDETNILGCLIAKEFGVKRTIARVSNLRLAKLAEKLGITNTICPEVSLAEKILGIIIRQESTVETPIATGITIIEIKIESSTSLIGKHIMDIPLSTEWLMVKVRDDEKSIRPKPNFILRSGHVVTLIVKEESVNEVMRLFAQA